MGIGVLTSHQFVQDKFGMTRKNGNWSFNESAVFRRAVVGLIALPVAQPDHHTAIKLRHKQNTSRFPYLCNTCQIYKITLNSNGIQGVPTENQTPIFEELIPSILSLLKTKT